MHIKKLIWVAIVVACVALLVAIIYDPSKVSEEVIDQAVERGLRRTRMESAGDDTGGTNGFKVYKPDTSDMNNLNPQKYTFGPNYQMRDVTTATKGGIIVTKSDDALEFSVGGPVVVSTVVTKSRPLRTAIFSLAGTPTTLYDPPRSFFSPNTSSIALIQWDVTSTLDTEARLIHMHEHRIYSESDLNPWSTDYVLNSFNIAEQGLYALRGTVVDAAGQIAVKAGSNGIIPVEWLESKNYFIKTSFHMLDETTSSSETNITWDFGGVIGTVTAPLDDIRWQPVLYQCWPPGQHITALGATPEQVLGMHEATSVEVLSDWASVPAQVYMLTQSIQDLNTRLTLQ